jgi:hypothetical protein
MPRSTTQPQLLLEHPNSAQVPGHAWRRSCNANTPLVRAPMQWMPSAQLQQVPQKDMQYPESRSNGGTVPVVARSNTCAYFAARLNMRSVAGHLWSTSGRGSQHRPRLVDAAVSAHRSSLGTARVRHGQYCSCHFRSCTSRLPGVGAAPQRALRRC